MSESTKTYRWLPWAVVVGGVILLGMFHSYFRLGWLVVDPWAGAHRVASLIAIHEFDAGIPDLSPYWETRIAVLASLLMLFVVGPSLWVFGEVNNQTSSDKKGNSELKKGFAWYFGAIVLVTGLGLALTGTIRKGESFSINSRNWEIAARSRNVDELQSELMTLAFEAAEIYYLSYDMGEDGGFDAIPAGDGAVRTLRLDDLESYGSDTLNTYVLAPIENDSMIIIYGIGHKPGKDPDFRNANGDRGKVQVAINVNPEGDIVQFDRASGNGS